MDQYNRTWITENAVEEIANYEDGVLTIRGLHYRLVSRGMTNTAQHYKRVVEAMIKARWEGVVSFETFSDHDREMLGITKAEETIFEDSLQSGKEQIDLWAKSYNLNRWENQPYYPEVFIEKKALQGVFGSVCKEFDVGIGACKGYPSLTFLNDTSKRLIHAIERDKTPILLYFGDYDPSGEDIPRSISENLEKLGVYDLEVRRIALLEQQVIDWKLPPAPAKKGDSRTANWDGLGQVELDAVEPNVLRKMCKDAILDVFDESLYTDLREREKQERAIYMREIKQFVNNELSL